MMEGDVSGFGPQEHCPKCGSGSIDSISFDDDDMQQAINKFTCRSCSHAWVVLGNFADGSFETRTLQ
jgi:transposase-like protein